MQNEEIKGSHRRGGKGALRGRRERKGVGREDPQGWAMVFPETWNLQPETETNSRPPPRVQRARLQNGRMGHFVANGGGIPKGGRRVRWFLLAPALFFWAPKRDKKSFGLVFSFACLLHRLRKIFLGMHTPLMPDTRTCGPTLK